ncbi:MAG: ATP-grasp domain-containing protein [Mangrovibacterium sp.]
MKKLAVILHNRLADHPTPDERDVLDQVDLVKGALTELGYTCMVRDIGFDLHKDISGIKELSPSFVFNLVETVFGQSELLHVIPSILASEHIPYTGVSDEGLFLTTRKTLAKKIMQQCGIVTPEWFATTQAVQFMNPRKKYILKPVAEEGSVKLDEDAVFRGDDPVMIARLATLNPDEYFVEEFVDGREFNLSVTGTPGNFKVYPVAEMIFRDFPEGKERILGYRAKWDEQSFEYSHTGRQFHTLDTDPVLQNALIATALKCGEAFHLSGYFRVDFRIAADGHPLVLEINGNPCISPDSGFIAAVLQEGMTVTEVIREIISCVSDTSIKT